jgi:hypothetical protein
MAPRHWAAAPLRRLQFHPLGIFYEKRQRVLLRGMYLATVFKPPEPSIRKRRSDPEETRAALSEFI